MKKYFAFPVTQQEAEARVKRGLPPYTVTSIYKMDIWRFVRGDAIRMFIDTSVGDGKLQYVSKDDRDRDFIKDFPEAKT